VAPLYVATTLNAVLAAKCRIIAAKCRHHSKMSQNVLSVNVTKLPLNVATTLNAAFAAKCRTIAAKCRHHSKMSQNFLSVNVTKLPLNVTPFSLTVKCHNSTFNVAISKFMFNNSYYDNFNVM
jgi:hypothetical protein